MSAQTGFLLECPPGFSCDAGLYPHVIVVKKGQIAFTPPTNVVPLRFTCCDGSVEVRFLPVNFTLAEFNAAAQSIVNASAVKLAQCMATQYNQQHARRPKKCTITTASLLPSGDIGVPFSVTLAQTGATLPVTWSLLSGALPPGLSLSSSGLLAGTPTGVGASYGFVVRLANTAGTSCTKLFTLTINDCASADWCNDPGACRLRIKDFNAADWVAGTFPPPFEGNPCDVSLLAGWDGTFSLIAQIGANPCKTYEAFISGSGFFDLDYDNFTGQWQLNYSTTGGTMYFANGPIDPSPLGVYTRDPDFSCTGPASLTLEAYTPSP